MHKYTDIQKCLCIITYYIILCYIIQLYIFTSIFYTDTFPAVLLHVRDKYIQQSFYPSILLPDDGPESSEICTS